MDEVFMERDLLERIFDGSMKPRDLKLSALESITENFSKERIIGTGGFGTVYKGVLRNGEVAVKRLSGSIKIDEKLFRREVDSLLNVSHENIVRFLGFCSHTVHKPVKYEGSYIYAEDRERLLCYEYINNGSLDNYIADELRGLPWDTRYYIIKGICKGLHYLHMEKHIIHMDLKPANVLLDNNMVAKITDFGLSRMEENAHTKSTTRASSPGYTAPEYIDHGRMSVMYDVYSLGIIIIELVTGHRSIPDITNVLRRWRHRLHESGKETPFRYQQIAKLIEIGLLCQDKDPYKRPFISDIIHVIDELESTNQITPFWEDDMLGIEPLELHFPYKLNSPISCALELTNYTDSFMAFSVQTTSPLPYSIQPKKDIVPPRSKCSVDITLQPLDKVPQDKHPGEFIVRSTKVKESLINKDITEDIFKREDGKLVDEVNLTIIYEPEMGYKLNDMSTGSKPHHLTLQHLKDITGNFSSELILGIGGFGVVYKGVLPSGEVVAVKKLLQARRISQKQFANEDNLMNLDHPNIVRLVGYCYETQRLLTPHEGKFVIAWNTECLLSLEYVPNGSLEKYISDASSGLNWRTRWEIIEGICFGLNYLHEQSNGPIIHMDLKPANILLGEKMVPKIADFGLSRLFYKKHIISTAITSGTLGYMPPEYLQGIITPKSDIFSLGVIIMEVITGHREYPSDITTSSVGFIELELQKWRNVLQRESDYTSLEMLCQQIQRCIQIGLICVNPERTKRPTMKKIINMLQGLESTNLYITNEIRASTSDEVIQFDPHELCFRLVPGKKVLSSVKIINITDYYVSFTLTRSQESTNIGNLTWNETEAILPPRSTKLLTATMEDSVKAMQFNEIFKVWYAIVAEDIEASDLDLDDYTECKDLPISLTKV